MGAANPHTGYGSSSSQPYIRKLYLVPGPMHSEPSPKKVGAIIERPNFYPYLSAYKNLEIVCLIKGVPLSAIEDKLELVGLLGKTR